MWPDDAAIRSIRSRARASSTASSCTLVGDENNEVIEQELIDLTLGDSVNGEQTVLGEGECVVRSLDLQKDAVRVGDLIQITDTMVACYKVEFILVKVLFRTNDHEQCARGLPFARTRCMLGKLPKKLNELCMIQLFKEYSQPGVLTPTLIDVPASAIYGNRSFVLTNALYPLHNPKQNAFMDFGNQATRMIALEEHGTLVCRWKLEIYNLGVCHRSKHHEEVFARLLPEEVPEQRYRSDESSMRETWRGKTTRGGSWTPESPATDIVGNDSLRTERCRGQRYTLFDSFCGAGGVSRGADLAGFHVQYAVDKSSDVWETYQANFPQCSLYLGSVDDFIHYTGKCQTKVDVLHLSPPCQPFSPAHTHVAPHDDENMFALMGCFSLINSTRPRIVTLEQTFGITHDKHGAYLRTLINDFTGQGFSVRWQVVRLARWGSAQDRKRLVMIAAAPGERLPPFPQASHSENGMGGLKPLNTIEKTLSNVSVGDDLHDLDKVKRHYPPKAPYRADRLAGTITTSPGGFYFPDGTRDLTLREYAALQGFPKHHTFIGTRTSILRQIGNAFPPNTVRHLYKHIETWLLEQDAMTSYRPRNSDIVDVETEVRSARLRLAGRSESRLLPASNDAGARVTTSIDIIDVDMREVYVQRQVSIVDLT